jgi:hypothetical protein
VSDFKSETKIESIYAGKTGMFTPSRYSRKENYKKD